MPRSAAGNTNGDFTFMGPSRQGKSHVASTGSTPWEFPNEATLFSRVKVTYGVRFFPDLIYILFIFAISNH